MTGGAHAVATGIFASLITVEELFELFPLFVAVAEASPPVAVCDWFWD